MYSGIFHIKHISINMLYMEKILKNIVFFFPETNKRKILKILTRSDRNILQVKCVLNIYSSLDPFYRYS